MSFIRASDPLRLASRYSPEGIKLLLKVHMNMLLLMHPRELQSIHVHVAAPKSCSGGLTLRLPSLVRVTPNGLDGNKSSWEMLHQAEIIYSDPAWVEPAAAKITV